MLIKPLRPDWRIERDWRRPWRDRPGYVGPGYRKCKCCACPCPCSYAECWSVTIPEANASYGKGCVSLLTIYFKSFDSDPCTFEFAGRAGDPSCLRQIDGYLFQEGCTLVLSLFVDGYAFVRYETNMSNLNCSYPGTTLNLVHNGDVVDWPSTLNLDVSGIDDCPTPPACVRSSGSIGSTMTATFTENGTTSDTPNCSLLGVSITVTYDAGTDTWVGTTTLETTGSITDGCANRTNQTWKLRAYCTDNISGGGLAFDWGYIDGSGNYIFSSWECYLNQCSPSVLFECVMFESYALGELMYGNNAFCSCHSTEFLVSFTTP